MGIPCDAFFCHDKGLTCHGLPSQGGTDERPQDIVERCKEARLMSTVLNFNAGPAMLPPTVLEKVQAELRDYRGRGMSIMEMSHRSKEYEAVNAQAEASLQATARRRRRLPGVVRPGRRLDPVRDGADELPAARRHFGLPDQRVVG